MGNHCTRMHRVWWINLGVVSHPDHCKSHLNALFDAVIKVRRSAESFAKLFSLFQLH